MTPEERKKTEIAEKKGVKAPDFRFQVECGSWETVIPEEKINDVRISIATTTFKKEDYITRNIGILERDCSTVMNRQRIIFVCGYRQRQNISSG